MSALGCSLKTQDKETNKGKKMIVYRVSDWEETFAYYASRESADAFVALCSEYAAALEEWQDMGEPEDYDFSRFDGCTPYTVWVEEVTVLP